MRIKTAMRTRKRTTQFVDTWIPRQSLGTRIITRTLRVCLALGAVTIAVSSASAQEAKPAEKVNYTDHVLPLFRAKCGTCHSAGQAKGGLVLESYSAAMTGGA